MRNYFLPLVGCLLLLSGCKKAVDAIIHTGTSGTPASIENGFIKYTIQKGQQYSDQSSYKSIETGEMKFVVKFDSSAIYSTAKAENQNDINKLYGFSDNNADHHQFSARFGWRWSSHGLRLFAYIYNEGAVLSKELAVIPIGEAVNCGIQVTSSSYLFTVNGVSERLPRMATTPQAKGYQLYPYFGGDETAPHDVHVFIKDL